MLAVSVVSQQGSVCRLPVMQPGYQPPPGLAGSAYVSLAAFSDLGALTLRDFATHQVFRCFTVSEDVLMQTSGLAV